MTKYLVDLHLNVATTVHGIEAPDEATAVTYARGLVEANNEHYVEREFPLDGHRVTVTQSDERLVRKLMAVVPEDLLDAMLNDVPIPSEPAPEDEPLGITASGEPPETIEQARAQLTTIHWERAHLDPLEAFDGNDDEMAYLNDTIERLLTIADFLTA